jgi:membrane associated protein
VEYFNLSDDDSRKQLSVLLSDAEIEEPRITALMNRVEQFNASVKSEWLTDGFESAAPTDTKYAPYDMQAEWMAANGSFPGYNCRITAFGLFSEFITAGADQLEMQGEDSLFTDLETIDADPDALWVPSKYDAPLHHGERYSDGRILTEPSGRRSKPLNLKRQRDGIAIPLLLFV